MSGVERRITLVDGHRVSYQVCGPEDGPPTVLVHGLASDSTTWEYATAPLAERGLRVIAVDLLGHGQSDKPRRSYLLEDFAAQLEAFFDALQLKSATLVGHSLGGAIAVHFGYYYPERVDRLVLVSAGGLGREVSLALRAGALPGAERIIGWAMGPRMRRLYAWPRLHRRLRLTPENVKNLRRLGAHLGEPDARHAFFAALRGVIEPGGQRGSFLEMRYLAAHVPTLVVWAEGDVVIPVAHAHATQAHLAGSRLLVFPGGGHEPHRRHAAEFARSVADFISDNEN